MLPSPVYAPAHEKNVSLLFLPTFLFRLYPGHVYSARGSWVIVVFFSPGRLKGSSAPWISQGEQRRVKCQRLSSQWDGHWEASMKIWTCVCLLDPEQTSAFLRKGFGTCTFLHFKAALALQLDKGTCLCYSKTLWALLITWKSPEHLMPKLWWKTVQLVQ